MTAGPQFAHLPGGRLHLHEGPIDVIISATGAGRETAFARACSRFRTILTELVSELDRLTQHYDGTAFATPVARRMARAVAPLALDRFITPMAAVAGAVADELLANMGTDDLSKITVNNGGDIAFFLTNSEEFHAATPAGDITVPASLAPRGIATSGWRGRSHSFGIADAVTVLAPTAAAADAAATLIANAVDLPNHPAITRTKADQLEAVPQLGNRRVTTAVGHLSEAETDTALARGASDAETLLSRNLIAAASLLLNGQTRLVASNDARAALSFGETSRPAPDAAS